jgi:ParB family chromosome partitioning protein
MKTQTHAVEQIDVDSIKIFVSRARDKAGFDEMKQSIKENGLKIPIGVRDISHRPASERKREGGGLCKFELIYGEGRLTAFKELGMKRIPAVVKDAPEAEIVGMFLAENMIRKPLPWAQKAKLIVAELQSGSTIEEAAKRFCITVGHAAKLARISGQAAKELLAELESMPVASAEMVTTLPKAHQKIVIETLKENPEREVREIVKKAKEITESGGELSKRDLQKSLQRIDEDLKRCRESMKVTRLHHSLGPGNIVALIENPKFRKALANAKVNVSKFETLINQ